MTLLAAFKVLLYRYSGQNDICIGTPIAGRQQEEVENLIGFFINTLALRTHINPEEDFITLLQEVKTGTLQAYQHQEVPFEKVVEAVVKQRDMSRSPLFGVMFVYQNTPEVPELNLGDVQLSRDSVTQRYTKFDLTFNLTEGQNGIHLTIEYCTDLFKEETILRMQNHFSTLLSSILSEPKQKIEQIKILTLSEENRILNEFNNTKTDYPKNKTVIDLFEQQSAKTPKAIAAVFNQEQITYKQLNQRANQVAQYLKIKGVKAETLVAICIDRSLEMIVGILGILKSGGAYMPIDPEYPQERISFMLEDSKTEIVLTSSKSQEKLPKIKGLVKIQLDHDWDKIIELATENPPVNITADNLAYVIYTSGSTGIPKGVMNEHGGLLNRLLWAQDYFQLKSEDSVLQKTTYCFDVSVWELIWPLIVGSKLVFAKPEGQKDNVYLKKIIEEQQVTMLHFVPSMLEAFLIDLDEGECSGLMNVICSGEALKLAQIKLFKEKLPHVNLHNLYGPTEAAIDVTYWTIPENIDKIGIVPIGKPVSNTEIHILGSGNTLLPIGIPGEIHIGGIQVARGYINREELTKEKFIIDTISNSENARMYKTGDLGRWLSDGNIEYLGRTDDQVKIRGYRIELGEIENSLEKSGLVNQAIVIAKQGLNNNFQLVAYVIPNEKNIFNEVLLVNYLRAKLPDYMLPNLWVELKEFPLTFSGKIDKKLLPEPTKIHLAEYSSPRNELETKLVEIWQDILDHKKLGIDDNFFSLGGHSLLVMRVVSAIRKEMNLEIAIKELFQYPTISELAAYLATQNEGILLPSIQKVNPRPEKIPLSFSQERLWFIDKLEGSLQYHLPTVLRLRGELNHEALERSIRKIIQRHEVLRTAIKERDGEAYQQINNSEDWKLEQTDGILYHLDPEGYLQDLIKTPFDLSKDYMLRCDLIKISNKEHLLVATLHHIASDAWSTSILVGEFVELYNASLENREALLPELSLQYADYSIWQRNTLQGEILENKLDYWKQKLEAITALELPTDYIRPAVRGIAGSTLGFKIDKQLSDKITQLSQSRGATLFMTLLAAYKTLLYRYSGQNDISVGTSIASRPLKELEELIGFFVNTLTLRDQVEEEMSFTDLLSSVKTTTLEAYQHQDIPFEKVVDAVVKGRDQSRSPLFQVMLVLANTPESETLRLGDVEIERERFGSDITKFDMTFFVNESEEGLYISIQYATDLFKEETVTRMGAHFVELLKSIIQNPEQKLGQFKLLSPSEEQELLHEINSSEVTYPKDKSIVELFEQQVELTPDSTALVFGDEALSYKELNQRANQLANYLQTKGVTTQTLVPLYTERGEDMIIGMLGILKAGGVYVPIDSESPQARINFVLEDTKAKVVVSQSGLKQKIKQSEVIDLDTDKETISKLPTTNPTNKTQSNNLAYIIYTSGSTGQPKGVMIEHRSLVDYVYGLKERTELEECKSFALVSTIATDLGNTVIYGSLLTGGALHVFSKETVSNIEEIHRYFKTRKIDCLKIVPSHWKALRMDDTLLLPQKLLIFGGEALQSEILDNIREANAECTVINHYGPTETTIGKLLHVTEIQRKYGRTIPIGKPFGNTRVYILSKSKTPCPIGVAGELYIGGDGLARGYLNNDALSKEKFIQNPFSNAPNDLIYATGDSVKYLPDGNIEYLGRIDEQLKIRGYRIEPGEIESSLEHIKTIERAVVVAKEDKQGNKRLVAYIVPNAGFEKEEIISQLKESLPDYMIPAQWIEIESVPLMASGKTNRKALPDADLSENLSGIYVAPTDETEQRLATIWEDILEVEKVGINDDFFELGGHSLLAIRLISAIRKAFEVEMPIGDIFDYPTIALLKTRLETSTETVLPPIQKAEPRPERIPLSFSQERLWFIDRLEGSLQYHIPTVLQLKGNLNKEALEKSIRKIIERHEVLRTVIKDSDGEAYQQINNSEDWKLEQTNGSEGNLEETIKQRINTPFDLSKDYMLRCTLIEQSQDEHTLVAVLHHIASDGWSTSLLVKEVVELYKANLENREAILPELSVQYADFAIWQRNYLKGEILNHKIDYWKQKLEDVETLELPTDYNRPVIQSTKGAIVYQNIDKQVAEKLNSISQQQGTTLFMTLLSAFKVLLYRYSGQTDICVGTPIAGRQQREVEDLIGFFINTLALRTELDPEKDFIKLLQSVKSTTLEAYKHQEAPFEKVVEAVVKQRDMSRSPIFQAMFIFQNTPDVPEMKLGEVDLTIKNPEHEAAKFELTLIINDNKGNLQLAIEYCTELFTEETVVRLQNHFSILLNSIVSNPSEKIGNLQLISSFEKTQLKETFNNTKIVWPQDKTLVELFEEQVEKTPDAIALLFEKSQITYSQLAKKSNQFAHYLKEKGVQENTVVPICMERTPGSIVSILGILKVNATYLPIDSENPLERIKYMLDDAGANILIADQEFISKHPDIENLGLIIINGNKDLINYPVNRLHIDLKSENITCLIYTSGSSGIPKGVKLGNKGLVNRMHWMWNKYPIEKNETWVLKTSFGFVDHIWELFGALAGGVPLLIIKKEELLDLSIFTKRLFENKISRIVLVPSLLDYLLKHLQRESVYLNSLKYWICSGETLTTAVTNEFYKQFHWSKHKLINIYGSTEVSADASYYDTSIDFEKSGNISEKRIRVPIGQPISNTQIRILDKRNTLSPIGVSGEICISGDGLALGFNNLPELTKEKFVLDPFNTNSNSKLFKTGDSGRWMPDGNIEYLGRIDNQIKIRGFRIELGEIESALQLTDDFKQSLVLAIDDESLQKQLVAFVVPVTHFNKDEIVTLLREKLPEYMVPHIWVEMASLPMTPSGKLDRKALQNYEFAGNLTLKYVAPRNETESKLVLIWENLLGKSPIGVHDNFFSLGGHSLLIMRLISTIRKELSVELSIKEIFQYPNIAELVLYIGSQTENSLLPSIEKFDNRPDLIPLSFAQERLWFIDRLEGSTQYHLPSVFKLVGNLNLVSLKSSFKSLVERHESLRTVIIEKNGDAYQKITSAEDWRIEELDGSLHKSSLKDLIQDIIKKPFDLAKDYMIRCHLINSDVNEHYLVVTLHHISSDAWSALNMLKEVVEIYNAYDSGREPILTQLQLQYADYAIWQRNYLQGETLSQKIDYWKHKLEGVTSLQLPTDFKRQAIQSSRGAISYLNINRELTNKLAALSQQQGTTMFMTLLAAFKLLLSRYSGQNDICVGTPVAGRQQKEIEDLIGFFINTLALRTLINPENDFNSLLQDVKHTVLDGYDNQDAPFEKVVEATVKHRDMSRTPLFQVAFTFQNIADSSDIKLGDVILSKESFIQKTSRFDLTFDIFSIKDELNLAIEYCTDLFKEETIRKMRTHFLRLLNSIVENPNQKPGDFQILDNFEQHQLLLDFNNTSVDYQKDKTVVDFIEEQVLKTPEAVAVVFENQQLTYHELNQKANQLSHYLQSNGVEAETIVPVCIERSVEMIIGILGILKAGGAYLPIDPEYPQERINFMLEDSGASIVLSNNSSSSKIISSAKLELLQLDSDWNKINKLSNLNPQPAAKANNLAYVIYTSGSTGQPKGVMNEHRGLLNRLLWAQDYYHLTPGDAVLQKTTYCFDVSVWELLWPLLAGSRLVFAIPEGHKDPSYLKSVIESQNITMLHFVPSMLEVFLSDLENGECKGLKKVLCSGEALKPSQVSFFKEKLPDSQLHNLYGPTEAAIDVTYWSVPDGNDNIEVVPIGKPVANTQLYLLGSSGELVPVGVSGEIHIGGIQVSRGYLNRPELTAEKFIKNPFSHDSNSRLYKTGDLGLWLPDGNIEYLGRADDQVKIRGFRIELGEIEINLAKCEGVQNAKVIVSEDELTQDKKLNAYLLIDNQKLPLLASYENLLNSKQIQQSDLHILPNDLPVLSPNLNEVKFLYKEIFEDQCYLKHGISLNNDSCVVDIGANTGFLNVFLNVLSENIKVYSFEPIPEVYNYLVANRELYNISGKAFQLAILDIEKEIEFNYFPQMSIVSSMSDNKTTIKEVVRSFIENSEVETLLPEEMDALLEAKLESRKITCKAKTLSQIIREENIEKIDLLKVDVENSEHLVLGGILDKDWEIIQSIIIEVHDVNGRLNTINKTLEDKGFKTFIEKESMLSKDDILYNIYATKDNKTKSLSSIGDKGELRSTTWKHPSEFINIIKKHLEGLVPDYMIPSGFMLLHQFPLTSNGKIDTRALPAFNLEEQSALFVAPETQTELKLAEIWLQLLRLESIGIHDNFFAIGGHSLLAMRVISAIRKQMNLEIAIKELFQHPTICELAEHLETKGEGLLLPPLEKAEPRPEFVPLSFSQERLWFIDKLEGSLQYHLPTVLRLKGDLNKFALEQSIKKIIERHEVLRTTIKDRDGLPYQQINNSDNWMLEEVDGSIYQNNPETCIRQLVNIPFDLSSDYMLRGHLIELSKDEHLLLATLHHIASDAWSGAILVNEVIEQYNAILQNREAILPELSIQYADYSIWQRDYLQGEILENKVIYWKQKLEGITPIELPTDYIRPTIRGVAGATLSFNIEKVLSDKIAALGQANSATLFMTLLAAYKTLLYRYSGQNDISVGTSIASRPLKELEGLIGFFVNTLTLRDQVEDEMSFLELLKSVKTTTLEAYQHQDIPFEKVVDAVVKGRDQSRSPLFQVMLVLANTPESDNLKLGKIDVLQESYDAEISKFDITFFVNETEQGLALTVQYATDLYNQQTIARMADHFVELLKSITENPEMEIGQLNLLTPFELQQLVMDFSSSKKNYDKE